MDNRDKILISEISNLSFVLIEFCEKSEQTQEIQGVCSLAKCIYEKVETLYLKNQNK